jgi:hypothetical protein
MLLRMCAKGKSTIHFRRIYALIFNYSRNAFLVIGNTFLLIRGKEYSLGKGPETFLSKYWNMRNHQTSLSEFLAVLL